MATRRHHAQFGRVMSALGMMQLADTDGQTIRVEHQLGRIILHGLDMSALGRSVRARARAATSPGGWLAADCPACRAPVIDIRRACPDPEQHHRLATGVAGSVDPLTQGLLRGLGWSSPVAVDPDGTPVTYRRHQRTPLDCQSGRSGSSLAATYLRRIAVDLAAGTDRQVAVPGWHHGGDTLPLAEAWCALWALSLLPVTAGEWGVEGDHPRVAGHRRRVGDVAEVMCLPCPPGRVTPALTRRRVAECSPPPPDGSLDRARWDTRRGVEGPVMVWEVVTRANGRFDERVLGRGVVVGVADLVSPVPVWQGGPGGLFG